MFDVWFVCCVARHLVLYEDGDKEWLNLTAERVEWEQEEQPDTTEAEVSDPAAHVPSCPAHLPNRCLLKHPDSQQSVLNRSRESSLILLKQT